MYSLPFYFEIAALISSLIVWGKIKRSRYLQLFPFLLSVIVFGELYGYYLSVKYHNNLWLSNIIFPIVFSMYFRILYLSLNNKSFKKFVIVASLIFALISAFTLYVYINVKLLFNIWMYISGTLILVACIVFKIYELLDDPTKLDFLKNPYFYILIFTLLFYIVTIPVYTMNSWLSQVKIDENITIINNVFNFLNIVLYGSYAMCFLWIGKADIS